MIFPTWTDNRVMAYRLGGAAAPSAAKTAAADRAPLVVATYASDAADLRDAVVMAESLREFGGRWRQAPVWLYLPEESPDLAAPFREQLKEFTVTVRHSATPEAGRAYPFSGKVFAAAAAEAAADGQAEVLAWLDPDTVFRREPAAFALPAGVALEYRPVMLRLIGSAWGEPPDEFWARLYRVLKVPEDAVWSVTTPVDGQAIRAYFNAGLLAVRPERGVLRDWPACFRSLYGDSFFQAACGQDSRKHVFLHQAALAGAVLRRLPKQETVEFPPTYNYPLPFHDRLQGSSRSSALADCVTLRHDVLLRQPGWTEAFDETNPVIAWLKVRYPAAGQGD